MAIGVVTLLWHNSNSNVKKNNKNDNNKKLSCCWDSLRYDISDSGISAKGKSKEGPYSEGA